MRQRRFLTAKLALLALPLLLSAYAQATVKVESRGRRFELNAQSVFSEGCLSGLCMCPIALREGLKGSFWMRPDQGRRDYALERVELLADTMSGLKTFVGGGRYVIDGTMQRMTLELSVKGSETILYDSGWVERPRNTVGIAIYLPMVEVTCWGEEFDLHAEPQQLSRLDPQGLSNTSATTLESFGTIKARW